MLSLAVLAIQGSRGCFEKGEVRILPQAFQNTDPEIGYAEHRSPTCQLPGQQRRAVAHAVIQILSLSSILVLSIPSSCCARASW